MSLSERERRVLAALEESIRSSDPRFAAVFTRPTPAKPVRRARVTATWFLGVAAALWVGALVFRDAAMATGGCLVLGCMPACVWLIKAVSGGESR